MVKPTDSTIAGLMTDGCNMGVKSLSKYLNQYKAADESAKDLCKRLIAIEEQLVYAAIWAGATPEEAMDRITFRADTSYLDSEVQLQSVVGMIQMNQQTRTLSNEALYRLLDKAVPGVLPTYEDNEIQKVIDMEEALELQEKFAPAPSQETETEEEDSEKDKEEKDSGGDEEEEDEDETEEKKKKQIAAAVGGCLAL